MNNNKQRPRENRKGKTTGNLGGIFNGIDSHETPEAPVRFDTRDSHKFYNKILAKIHQDITMVITSFQNERTFPFPNNVTELNHIHSTIHPINVSPQASDIDMNKIQTTDAIHNARISHTDSPSEDFSPETGKTTSKPESVL